MDEKNLSEDPSWRQYPRKPQLRHWTNVPLLRILLALANFFHGLLISMLEDDLSPAGEYIHYGDEALLWKPCGELRNSTLECSNRLDLSRVRSMDLIHNNAEVFVFAWTHNYVRGCADTVGRFQLEI
jgi:hypothetical protein